MLDIDRMVERGHDRALARYEAAQDRAEAELRERGPQALDCDEPDACTCSTDCGRCER